MHSHCAAPLPLLVSNGVVKVFFGTRDANSNIRVAYCVYSVLENRIKEISSKPVLDLGMSGFFDDNALYPSCIVENNGELLMYYAGRSRGVEGLYYVSLGLAKSIDGGKTFQKHSRAPIMQRSEFDPWMVGLCHVMKSGSLWEMLYTSGKSYDLDKKSSSYDIKYASSFDGVTWIRDGLVCIPCTEDFSNVAAPSVIKLNNAYHMWFCYSVENEYRIGYAKSFNYKDWEVDYSPKRFKNIEAAYPKAIVIVDKIFIFYSKGRYGYDGIECISFPQEEVS